MNTQLSAQRQQMFERIKIFFEKLDDEKRKNDLPLYHDTTHGIWGPSGMDHVYELFTKLHLEKYSSFADLGSGDGRIAFIASLFTKSHGFEIDARLHEIAQRAAQEINKEKNEEKDILQNSCTFIKGDYTAQDMSKFDILFTFQDQPWQIEFEEKLMQEFNGVLLSYNKIFLPNKLKKGRTYWIKQQPIITYHINRVEEELF